MNFFTKLLVSVFMCAVFISAADACELLIKNDGKNPIIISSKKLKQPQDFNSFPGIKIGVRERKSMTTALKSTLFVYELIGGTYQWKANMLLLACPTLAPKTTIILYYQEIIGKKPQPRYLEVNGKRSSYGTGR